MNEPNDFREEMRRALDEGILEAAALPIGGRPIVCMGCGCTDAEACPGGCFWCATDPETGNGICSTCVGIPIADLCARSFSK